jgi:hypothetical protein
MTPKETFKCKIWKDVKIVQVKKSQNIYVLQNFANSICKARSPQYVFQKDIYTIRHEWHHINTYLVWGFSNSLLLPIKFLLNDDIWYGKMILKTFIPILFPNSKKFFDKRL